MLSLHDVLTEWHDFFVLLGTAAGTLVGLLFVAASVSAGVFSLERGAPLRMFLTATVVHFSSILAVSLIILLPLTSWPVLGAIVLVCALVGLGYSALALRDSVRDGLITTVDWEDRTCTACCPSSPTPPRLRPVSLWCAVQRRDARCWPRAWACCW